MFDILWGACPLAPLNPPLVYVYQSHIKPQLAMRSTSTEFDHHAGELDVPDNQIIVGVPDGVVFGIQRRPGADVEPPADDCAALGGVVVIVLVRGAKLHSIGHSVVVRGRRQCVAGVSAVPGHAQAVLDLQALMQTRPCLQDQDQYQDLRFQDQDQHPKKTTLVTGHFPLEFR